MPTTEHESLAAFRPDPRNARKHGPKNMSTLVNSLQEVGAGRSIVTTRDGTIIAGNATAEAAMEAGIEDVVVVRTDGSKLLVHVREDLGDGDKMATLLGLYDNRTGELAEWDVDTLIDIEAEFQNDPVFDHIFSHEDFDRIVGDRGPDEPPSGDAQLGTLFEYRVVVDCVDEADQAALIADLEATGRTVKALVS